MRVISQSGRFDLPYEQIYVYRNDDDVECRMCGNKDNWVLLGHYSSPEKAEKAMEMCRRKYSGFQAASVLLNGASSNPINEVLSEYITNTIMESSTFRFPADEDVEVEDE